MNPITSTKNFFSIPTGLGSLFNGVGVRVTGDNDKCCSLSKTETATLSTPCCYAVAAYLSGLKTSCVKKVEGFLGHPSKNVYTAEYVHSDGSRDVCAWNCENGALHAGRIVPGVNTIVHPSKVGKGGESNGVIVYLLAMIPYLRGQLPEVDMAINTLTTDVNVYDIYDKMPEDQKKEVLNAFFLISDAFYCALRDGLIKVNIPKDNNVDRITMDSKDAFSVDDETIICSGEPVFFKRDSGNGLNPSSTSKKVTIKDARTEFASVFSHRVWSEKEKALIPEFSDDFPVPRTVIKMAKRYVDSKGSKRPAANFGWRGPTSIGKSTGVEILACILNIPLVHMTCYPDMETSNFMSEFVPDTSVGKPADDLPSFMDIFDDPVESYKIITGKEDKNATCETCLAAYADAVAAAKADAPRFRHVESQYVKALRNGWMVEIAEPSRIRDAGTLVGLNGVDKPGSIVTLVDGSSFRRHEDAIVVFTDNVGYVSCRPMDNAVIRRLSFIIDSSKLSKKELFERTKYNTGFDNRDVLETMYKVFTEIERYCHDNDVTGGSVSPTEFEMWALFVKGDGYSNLRENCIDCVVSKATDDPDIQNEIKSACLDRYLT